APWSVRESARAQRFLHLRPETLATPINRRRLLHPLQLLEETPLVVGHALRRPDLYAYVQVPLPGRVHARQAATAQMKDLTALRACRDVERHARRHRRH